MYGTVTRTLIGLDQGDWAGFPWFIEWGRGLPSQDHGAQRT